MSELAYNSNGDTFEVPAKVTGWRVRRLKPRGAPEVVYARDGLPLLIPIESDLDDLRRAVEHPGKYRLDPTDEDRRVVEGVPAAYVQVVPQPADGQRTIAIPMPSAGAEQEAVDIMREALRMNTELARTVIVQFPTMMQAAAILIQAADGAGIPARPALTGAVGDRDGDGGEDQGDEDGDAPSRGLDLESMIAQIVPAIVTGWMSGKLDGAKLAEILDWRRAAAAGSPAASVPEARKRNADAPSNPKTAAMPALDPAAMAHFLAIQAALTPAEATMAREVAKDLTEAELRAWFDELDGLSVPDAVAKIRALVGTTHGKTDGGAA
jgi:hypothetical protein